MKSFNLKKMAGVAALGVVTVLGMSESASAQGRRNDNRNDRRIERQQDRIEKQQNKVELERLRLERERLQRQRENLNARNNNNRFRVNRGGQWYNTDQRGANLLRQAVNAGYQQGFNAGKADRNRRVRSNWSGNSIYRSGTFGYQSHVDRSLYQHYFQQGFQRGYQDGFNSRFQYGYNSGGTVNILGTILNSLLNIQQY